MIKLVVTGYVVLFFRPPSRCCFYEGCSISKAVQCIKIKWKVIAALNATHLFHCSIIIFHLNLLAHWHICSVLAQVSKFCHSRIWLFCSQPFMTRHSHFAIIVELVKIQVPLKSDYNNEYFTWRPIYIYDNISQNSSYNVKCFRQKF